MFITPTKKKKTVIAAMRTMLDEVMFKNEGGKIRLTNRVSGEFEKKKKISIRTVSASTITSFI